MRDLVPFVQFKKCEKHPWRSVTFSKPAILLKVTLLQGGFSRFLNCTMVPNRAKHHIIITIIQLLAKKDLSLAMMTVQHPEKSSVLSVSSQDRA